MYCDARRNSRTPVEVMRSAPQVLAPTDHSRVRRAEQVRRRRTRHGPRGIGARRGSVANSCPGRGVTPKAALVARG